MGDNDEEGEGDWSSDDGLSFFISSPLALDSMAGIAGDNSVCTGLTGSVKPLLLVYIYQWEKGKHSSD